MTCTARSAAAALQSASQPAGAPRACAHMPGCLLGTRRHGREAWGRCCFTLHLHTANPRQQQLAGGLPPTQQRDDDQRLWPATQPTSQPSTSPVQRTCGPRLQLPLLSRQPLHGPPGQLQSLLPGPQLLPQCPHLLPQVSGARLLPLVRRQQSLRAGRQAGRGGQRMFTQCALCTGMLQVCAGACLLGSPTAAAGHSQGTENASGGGAVCLPGSLGSWRRLPF